MGNKRQGVVSVLGTLFRGTPRDEVISYLRVLARVLKEAPVEKRLELAASVIAAERRERERYEALLASHERKLKDVQAKYESDVQVNNAKYRRWQELGVYGIAAGFSLLIVVSFFLAFLSMERHTRALEQLTSQLSRSRRFDEQEPAA